MPPIKKTTLSRKELRLREWTKPPAQSSKPGPKTLFISPLDPSITKNTLKIKGNKKTLCNKPKTI